MPLDMSNNVGGSSEAFVHQEEVNTIVQDIEEGEDNHNLQHHQQQHETNSNSATSGNSQQQQQQSSTIQPHNMAALVEDSSRSPPSKQECTKLVLSLSREIAVYCCLSMGIGGMSDCVSLRDELRCLGRKTYDLIMLCKRRLMPLLLSKRVKEEERMELERLYRIFFGCVEMLQAEFVRAIALQSLFPLWDPSTLLIQTGITDWMVTKKSIAKALIGDQCHLMLSAQDHKNIDTEEFLNLERKVASLQELSYSTSQIMDIKPWDHMPDLDHTKIQMEASEGAELEISPADGGQRPKHRKCIILTLVIGSLVIVAGVLGLALALPSDDNNNATPSN